MLFQLIKKIKFNFFQSIIFPFILLCIFTYFEFSFNSNYFKYLIIVKLIIFPIVLFLSMNISKKDRDFLINNIQ